MANDVTSPIAGAEIVSDDGTAKPLSEAEKASGKTKPTRPIMETQTEFNTEEFEALKGLVSRKTSQADTLKSKVKELAESVKNIFGNDAELAAAQEKEKEVKKEVKTRRAYLNNQPETQDIKFHLKEAKEELKDVEDSLSNQLLNLYQMTGVKEFETAAGEVREFVIKARVKAKKV
jgi:oligoendopeptidase F